MSNRYDLAVVGAGLIGFRHIEAIKRVDEAILAAVVEPNPIQGIEAPVFASLNEMFDAIDVDGVILSTPTPMHVCGGLDCVNRGVPVLIEKPLGTNVDEARGLIKAAKRANVPVLVGHHRRYDRKDIKTLLHEADLEEVSVYPYGAIGGHALEFVRNAILRQRSGKVASMSSATSASVIPLALRTSRIRLCIKYSITR